MTGEVQFAELTTVKDGLLDSQVAHHNDTINGALQSQWEVIRDGLVQGVGAQVNLAKDNSLLTGVSMAGSFGLGAGLTWALKAGGRWGTAAEFGAAAFTGLMLGDVARRASAIQDVYSNTSGDTLGGQAARKDAIAQYAGSGVVDYSLMLASGGLGAASVHFAPKIAGGLRTMMEPLTVYGSLESARLQPIPVRVNASYKMMNLGETGNLGAKEIAPASDAISAARAHLEFPHRSVGLDQLSALMEAKQLAAHPDVKPVFQQMAETLGKVDSLKPQLARDEQALGQLQKELGEVKSLKQELQAVRQAEGNISSLRADMERIPVLREQQSSLTRQIQDAKGSTKAGGEAAGTSPGSEELRTQRREITDSISKIQEHSRDLPRLQQQLSEAHETFSKRKAAIEAGEDPQVKQIEVKIQPLQASVEAARAQLSSFTEQLGNLNQRYQTTSDAVRPTLKDSDTSLPLDVPKYVKPKLEIELSKTTARPRKADTGSKAEPPPLSIEESVPAEIAKPAGPSAGSARAAVEPTRIVAEKPAEKDSPLAKLAESKETPVERAATQAEVNRAYTEARQSVEDFTATHKRHTTALKKVNDYIETAFSWFAGDKSAATNVPQIAANVDTMLAKLENWDRSPSWLRPGDRAQTMQRNGFDAATMDKFDQWFQTQNKAFNDNGNLSPDRKLSEIQQHLSRRVTVESVKNWLRMAPDVKTAVSPIVQNGFEIMASGKLPDGRVIPQGSDMIVFDKVSVKGPSGDQEVVLPFAKDGQHVQRFDDSKISEGLRKLDAITAGGPQAVSPEDLYGFRLDHDPSRLTGAKNQVGYAILRPGGQYGKNIMYLQFADDLDPSLIPRALRADVPGGQAGTNTGVLYNMVKNAGRNAPAKPAPKS